MNHIVAPLFSVGVGRFELPTFPPQAGRANQTAFDLQ